MCTKYLLLISAFLISACSGGSDSIVSDDEAGNTRIVGEVIDAVNRSPLPGVEVSSDDLNITALTGSDGGFDFGPVESGNDIDLRFSLEGYQSALYAQPPLDETTNDLGVVQLVSNDNLGIGSIGGSITNSQGTPLAGVLLRFIAGINSIEGITLVSTTTDAQGFWSVTGLEAGNYTCIILVEGGDPIYETVQVLGGIDVLDANIVVPASTNAPTFDLPSIDFPEDRSHSEYGEAEVTWSYYIYDYNATSGTYTVDQNDRIATNTLLFFGTGSFDPIQWSQSIINISHTFAGPGVYPIVTTREELLSAALENQPAATLRVAATGPQGAVGASRVFNYTTIYVPAASSGSGSISVTVDNAGRYRFSVEGVNLIQESTEGLLENHPDAPSSITLNLSNGYVP